MKLFKSFNALKGIAVPALLCTGSMGGNWVRPDYDLSRIPLRPQAAGSEVLSHSHNDYEQENPLVDALMHGFDSVEVDVWIRGDRFLVSHLGWNTKGTLEELYLEPLRKLVDARGSVYGDGRTFYLWVDVKRHDAGLARKLHETLSRYPMLTRFTPGGEERGAVTVILTGSERTKKEYVSIHPVRYATRDSVRYDGSDPRADGAWAWYSLKWTDYFRWDGRGPMPARERRRLEALVRRVHAKGRRLRLWGVPQTEEFWAEAAAAGVDTLQTDSLPRLSRTLAAIRRGLAGRLGSHAPGSFPPGSFLSGSPDEEPGRADPSASPRLLTGDAPLVRDAKPRPGEPMDQ